MDQKVDIQHPSEVINIPIEPIESLYKALTPSLGRAESLQKTISNRAESLGGVEDLGS